MEKITHIDKIEIKGLWGKYYAAGRGLQPRPKRFLSGSKTLLRRLQTCVATDVSDVIIRYLAIHLVKNKRRVIYESFAKKKTEK
ncbi:MAG: hypothetical protein ABFS56_08355 [Pseudomonadota bacterium]